MIWDLLEILASQNEVGRRSFEVGEWLVEPDLDRISRGGQSTSLRPQVMELLTYLAERPGQVVGSDELITGLWAGKVVTSSSVYNCVAELRQALSSNGYGEAYIETIRKRGYRLVAPVSGLKSEEAFSDPAVVGTRRTQFLFVAALVALFGIGLAGVLFVFKEFPDPSTFGAGVAQVRPSIAVLPFKDLSPDGDQAYFSEGLAEEVLNQLAQLSGLRVISRSSSFALGEENLSSTQIGKRLDSGYLLEGSVRKAGNRVRITAQLIDAHKDTHIWSETYDRPFNDIFAIQNEIAAKVAEGLKVHVLGASVNDTTHQSEAFELYLQGRYEVARRLPDNLRQGEAFFRRAIDIDPEYAPAYAGLAKALYLRGSGSNSGDAVLLRAAEEALDTALQLDARNAEALATKGLMTLYSDREKGRNLLEQAIEINPSDSDAYRWLALSYEQTAPLRYLDLMVRAYLVDPLGQSINFHRVDALSALGRFSEARDAASEWQERIPGFGGPLAMVGGIGEQLRDPGLALRCYFAAYRLDPEWDVAPHVVSSLLSELGLPELAWPWSQAAWQNVSGAGEQADDIVLQRILVKKLTGDKSAALRLLEQAEARYAGWPVALGRAHLIVSEDFAQARSAWEHGRFEYSEGLPYEWGVPEILDYALILQQTGSPDRANQLVAHAEKLVDGQLEAGMSRYATWRGVRPGPRFYQGVAHAMRGDAAKAVASLRSDVSHGSVSCVSCLRIWPHFDAVHADKAFAELLAEQEAGLAARRDGLLAEGLLLTPDQVLALEDFDFDPFQPGAQ